MKAVVSEKAISRGESLPREISSIKSTEIVKTVPLKRPFRQIRIEKIFKGSLVLLALSILIMVVAILLTLVVQSLPSIKALGIKFLFEKTWDPVSNVYGA